MEVTMHHNEEKQQESSSLSPTSEVVEGGEMTMGGRRNSKDHHHGSIVEDQTFSSAMDLSGVLDSSQISTSSGDSNNSSSSSYHYSSSELSSSLSTSASTSVHSNSSSGADNNNKTKQREGRESSHNKVVVVDKDVKPTTSLKKAVKAPAADTRSEGSPVFATCSTFSSSSSTASASTPTVRRSESWGALRSASVESGKSSGGGGGSSDKENSINSGDFKSTSMGSMTNNNNKDLQQHEHGHHHHHQHHHNHHNHNESHHNLETYHTPSASMHSITPKLSRRISSDAERERSERLPASGEDNTTQNTTAGGDKNLKTTDDLLVNLTEEKKDLSNNATLLPSETLLPLVKEEAAAETDKENQLLDDEKVIESEGKTTADDKLDIVVLEDKLEKENKLSATTANVAGQDSSILGFGIGLDLINAEHLASISSESNASKDGSNGIGPTTKELAKAAKLAARKPAKKRNWYQQIFSASYKSRSGDFKKLFKELPIKERLLVDYSCALQKEILVQGRMYVSQGYLSFHANIFGWETQTSLRLRDVTSITKEKTALVIPNAIQVIVDGGDKLFFTSFVTRDATYLMLFKLWQNALLEDGMPSKEIQRLIHSSYGEELVITSDDEIDSLSCKSAVDLTDGSNIIAVCRDSDGSKSIVIDPSTKVNATNEIGPAIIVTGSLSSSIASPKAKEGLGGGHHLHHNGSPAIGLEPSDLSESSESDEEFQAAEGMEENDSMEIPPCPVSHTEGRETINAIIPCNIDQLFTMLFTSSKFYLDFHTSRKTFNIHQAQWEFGKDGKQTRQVSMTVSLNAVMGPKHSQITETQIMDTVSKPGLFYVIDCESVNAGVPYADTFYVTVHFCLSRTAATETRLAVVADIKYRKSVWGITKSIIEKNAWAGLEEFYSHLERALKEECSKMMLGGSPLPSPKHSSSVNNGARRRPPRNTNKKGQAPGIPVNLSGGGLHRTGLTADHITPALSTTSSSAAAPVLQTDTPSSLSSFNGEGSMFLKIILCVLGGLLVLNAFLYFKLTALETSTTSSTLFPPPSFTFTGEMPQNHQDWLLLLQKQESLHRIELQKWHEILMSALKILHQAESDLEALKLHIGSYSGGKYSVGMSGNKVEEPPPSADHQTKKSADENNIASTTGDSLRQDNRVDL